MHFQIFIPGKQGTDPQHLADVGLPGLAAGALFLATRGPDDQSGLLISWPGDGPPKTGYDAERQTWRPAVPQGAWPAARYWIGFWNESPPRPEELAVTYQQAGSDVELGDGQRWLIPHARELPAEMKLADDGTWRFAPQRQFHELWIAALRWRDWFQNAKPGDTYEYADMAEFVLQALQVNYRMTREVVDHLKLFVAADGSHPRSITRAGMEVMRQL